MKLSCTDQSLSSEYEHGCNSNSVCTCKNLSYFYYLSRSIVATQNNILTFYEYLDRNKDLHLQCNKSKMLKVFGLLFHNPLD